MQVAQAIQFKGHKLLTNALTLDRARFVINRLSGEHALVFIDNFSDDVDATQFLVQQPGILVVGFDRDYRFETAAHRLDLTKCHILPVTELPPSDIQDILSHIPENVRRQTARPIQRRSLSADEPPSVFEIIEANIIAPSLARRFHSVVRELARTDRNLLDLLLVCCYVHKCRTVVSMDMLIAFFRDRVNHYTDIYEMCDRLAAMISNYVGPFADMEQDYCVPRSANLAEAIIAQAPRDALRRVLLRFHKEISPYRIPRHDVFQRLAYDAALMSEVFPDWREGRDFYRTSYIRHDNPFMLQQGALYLARKSRYDDAFLWIDEAIMKSGGRHQTILNSHAVILFNANISKDPADMTVRETLQRSMNILSECYHSDRRRYYHAPVFADQALQYWDVYGDEKAHEYLKTAKQWLEDEVMRSKWHRNVRRLLGVVTRKLIQIDGE